MIDEALLQRAVHPVPLALRALQTPIELGPESDGATATSVAVIVRTRLDDRFIGFGVEAVLGRSCGKPSVSSRRLVGAERLTIERSAGGSSSAEQVAAHEVCPLELLRCERSTVNSRRSSGGIGTGFFRSQRPQCSGAS